MLPVGLIGAGAEWDRTWKPAILAQSRLKVAAVYDPIAVRGEAVARDFEASHVSSARDLIARESLRGVLVLDAGWLGAWAAREAARVHRPILVTQGAMSFPDLTAFTEADVEDLALQPDLRKRYTPSTIRLRELTATALGPIDFISILGTAASETDAWALAELIDWCRFVVQSSVVKLTSEWQETDTSPTKLVRLLFRREKAGRPIAAEIRLSRGDEARTGVPSSFSAEVACATGTVWIRDNRRIGWRTSDDSRDEELSDDRSSAHVQLDLFARRLVGAPVPAATIDDIRVALRLAAEAT
jgi:hypothetical protein